MRDDGDEAPVRKLKYLEEKKADFEENVSRRLPGKSRDIIKFVGESQMRAHNGSKQSQQNKFTRLVEKKREKSEGQEEGLAGKIMSRWVKNCSDRILSDLELSVLKKGLNFAVTPRQVPFVDMITITETACRNLNIGDANELRAKMCMVVDRCSKIKDQNVMKDEMKSIDNLRKDDSITILPADKGRVTVVMNKKEYENKCKQLLGDEKTYKRLKGDLTRKFKGEIVSILKDFKERKVITPELHKKLYPTVDQPPRFYGLPKVHKINTALRPIVSSIGTITYACAKYLADVLSPLMGKTEHHVKNSLNT